MTKKIICDACGEAMEPGALAIKFRLQDDRLVRYLVTPSSTPQNYDVCHKCLGKAFVNQLYPAHAPAAPQPKDGDLAYLLEKKLNVQSGPAQVARKTVGREPTPEMIQAVKAAGMNPYLASWDDCIARQWRTMFDAV